jgi:uncharacterized protein (TIGR02391 family)
MKAALPKIMRRLEELKSLDPGKITERNDQKFKSVQLKIDDTLVDIFGIDTIEYKRYRVGTLDTAGYNMLHPTPLREVIEGYKKGIEQANTKLKTIIDIFQERLGDLGETPDGRARKSFGDLDIHPEIEKTIGDLFKNGHYANAIEDSCKVLDLLVKMRSGRTDLSGTELMHSVFSPKNPVLKFNEGNTDSENSEQQGMMYLYAGAMLAFRNPRAHGIIEDLPDVALEAISFISFLAKSLDKAKRNI